MKSTLTPVPSPKFQQTFANKYIKLGIRERGAR
jgi:hypothetical protein